jgi:VanZ family protein
VSTPLRMGIGAEEGMWRRRVYLVLLLLWASFTFLLTSLPNVEMPVQFLFADKAAHFGFYGVMGVLCGLWRRASGESTGRAVLQTLLFIAVTGAVDEIHQYWIPTRDMDLFDWAADLVGGGTGGAFSAVLPRIFPFLLTE